MGHSGTDFFTHAFKNFERLLAYSLAGEGYGDSGAGDGAIGVCYTCWYECHVAFHVHFASRNIMHDVAEARGP